MDGNNQPDPLTPSAVVHPPEMAPEKASEIMSTSEKRPQNPDEAEAQTSKRCATGEDSISAFKALGWLDRFLALWIFLAMAVGIILGNFVPSTGPSLQKGKFVGVSVPIGTWPPWPWYYAC